MSITTTKQSWWKNVFQRLQVIFGPKRLTLDSAKTIPCEDTITIPEEFEFNNLITLYQNYTLKVNGKIGKYVISNTSSETIEDDNLLQKLEFINIWRKCASGNVADEDDEVALSICFSDEALQTYNKITKYAILHLLKYGNIVTKEILDVTKDMPYKWSRQTARKLFKNASQAQAITDYYRLATPDAKEQTEKTLTTDQALYGLD